MTAFDVLRDLSGRLKDLGLEFYIGGSVASSIWAEPRSTNDIDLVVHFRNLDPDELAQYLPDNYLLNLTEIQGALSEAGPWPSFQILEVNELVKFDCFVPRDEFGLFAFTLVRDVEIEPGHVNRIASPENSLLTKLRWYDAGNRVSPNQLHDIRAICQVQFRALDWTLCRTWATKLGIADLMTEFFSEAERQQTD